MYANSTASAPRSWIPAADEVPREGGQRDTGGRLCGDLEVGRDRLTHRVLVGRRPFEGFRHRRGVRGDQVGVLVEQGLRRDVREDGESRDRRLVGGHDRDAAAAHDHSAERVGRPRGIHRPRLELGRHVGEGDLDELDRRRVAAVVLDGLADREVTGRADRVDRHLLAGEVCRTRDARVAERDDGVHVVALGVAVGVVADDHDAEVLLVGADRTERLADRELDVAADQGGDGVRATLGGHDLDLETVVREDPLVDGRPEGAGLGDRERRDAYGRHLHRLLAGGRGGRRGCGIGAAAQGECGRGQHPQGGKTLLH